MVTSFEGNILGSSVHISKHVSQLVLVVGWRRMLQKKNWQRGFECLKGKTLVYLKEVLTLSEFSWVYPSFEGYSYGPKYQL